MKNKLIFASLILSNYIQSQDSLKKIQLPEIQILEITNKQGTERLNTIQGTSIYAGKKNEIIQLSATNADLSTNNTRQVFAKVPGVSVWENDGSGVQVGIATRGLSPNRSWEFNVRQNGYDISSDAFGYPEAYYTPPMEAVEKIELVRGAASLQYGTQFGGLLNFVMKKSLGDKPFQAESMQTVGSFGLLNTYNAIGGKIGKFSYFGFFQHRQADGWRQNSRYKTMAGGFQMSYEFSQKLSISAEYTSSNHVSQQAGGLTDEQFQLAPQYSSRKRNWMSTPWNVAALTLDWNPSQNLKVTTKVFGVLAERNSIGFMKTINIPDTFNTAINSYNYRQLDREFYKNIGAEIRMLQKYKLFNQEHALSAGIRIYRGNTLRRNQGIGSGGSDYELTIIQLSNGKEFGRSLDFTTNNAAVFAENLFHITSKWSIVPGIRYEFIQSLTSGYINTSSTGAIPDDLRNRHIILMGMGTEYSITNKSSFYANFSQNYRPVTFSELTPSATTDIIDPNMKDASGYNADAGYRGQLWNGILEFDVNYFYLHYNNRIGNVTQNNVQYRTNIGTSVSQGVESFLEVKPFAAMKDRYLGNLSIFGNYAFVNAIYTRWDNPAIAGDPSKSILNKRVENAPKHIIRAGLSYRYKRFSVAYQFNYVGEVYTDAVNTIEPNATATVGLIPSYKLMDITAGFQVNTKVSFKAGVNNLMDVVYATRRAGGYPGPGLLPGVGRNFFATLCLKL
ncbi:MAG: hypothetical protein RL264_1258 [Bacteroidota bacterium]|jgi:Fe(3+) dicitrate transport protein